jgi:hypothetical protein
MVFPASRMESVAMGIRGMRSRGSRVRNRRGQALAEMAIVLPILLLLVFGIIEMANAWRTFQVVVNAAREGARVAILSTGQTAAQREAAIEERVEQYLISGNLDPDADGAAIIIRCFLASGTESSPVCGTARSGGESRIRVEYPYDFMLLRPVVRLACGEACTGGFGQITIASTASMRNE